MKAWDKVLLARLAERPTATYYIDKIFEDFVELHGDRYFSDDKSIITGIGLLDKIPVTVIAEEKGKGTKDKIYRNFGMPNPEGYRKALRAMKQAEKFNRPVVTFIDTPGAYPGIGAEERGQGEAIARNLMEMSLLKVPIICVVIGEGSSRRRTCDWCWRCDYNVRKLNIFGFISRRICYYFMERFYKSTRGFGNNENNSRRLEKAWNNR